MFALQVITARDVQSLAVAAGLIVLIVLVAVTFRRQLKGFLTTSEWRIFFKLVGIVLLALLLIFTHIAVEFPSAQFIYGRF